MTSREAKFPNKSLIIGILLIISGSLLLLWRLRLLPSLGSLWPLPFFLLGLGIMYVVFIKGKAKRYSLPGMILTLGGIFFLLKNFVIHNLSLSRTWPVLMLITGLSFLPYGFSKRSGTRIAIVIPALAIVGLSVVFFPFSMGLVEESFTDFVLTWWPTLLLLGGLILIFSYIKRKKTG
jgi:hypothetical protein